MDTNVSDDIIHVNMNNTDCSRKNQDGEAWATAFSLLQDALDEADKRLTSTIWVAMGIYLPSKLYTPSGIPGGASGITETNLFTFSLPKGVALYGGFNGTETQLRERNPKRNATVLSGASVFWHVVTLGNDISKKGVSAILDGFTITQGNATGPVSNSTTITSFGYAHSYGGGIYSIYNSALTLKHCLVVSNNAAIGGGVFSVNSHLVVDKCVFKCNYANQQAGVLAVHNINEGSTSDGKHTVIIKRSQFLDNTTATFGGAIVMEGTLPHCDSVAIIKHCMFSDNRALAGGAIVLNSLGTNIKQCNFSDNVAYVSAGAVATTNAVNTITKCNFSDNQCSGNVALHAKMSSPALPLTNAMPALSSVPSACLDFSLGGGALSCNMNGCLDVVDCKFNGNKARNSNGGAILNGRAAAHTSNGSSTLAKTSVQQCEFVGNEAVYGGAIASEPSTFVFSSPLVITVADTVLHVKGSSFYGNKALLHGGGISLNKTTATLANNSFKRNTAYRGKAILSVESVMNDSNKLDSSLSIQDQ